MFLQKEKIGCNGEKIKLLVFSILKNEVSRNTSQTAIDAFILKIKTAHP